MWARMSSAAVPAGTPRGRPRSDTTHAKAPSGAVSESGRNSHPAAPRVAVYASGSAAGAPAVARTFRACSAVIGSRALHISTGLSDARSASFGVSGRSPPSGAASTVFCGDVTGHSIGHAVGRSGTIPTIRPGTTVCYALCDSNESGCVVARTSVMCEWLDALDPETFFWSQDVPGPNRVAVRAFLHREISKPDCERKVFRVAP